MIRSALKRKLASLDDTDLSSESTKKRKLEDSEVDFLEESDESVADDMLDELIDSDNEDDPIVELAAKERERTELMLADSAKEFAESSKMQQQMDEEESDLDGFRFPSKRELMEERSAPAPELAKLKERIEMVVQVLGQFSEKRDGLHSRKEYVSLLKDAIARYFGYSDDLVQILVSVFGPQECVAYIEASEQARPLTIRCNALLARRREVAQRLIERGINVDPLADWTKEGLTVVNHETCAIPIGATPEYLAGLYLIQSAASMIPVLCMDIRGEQRVLDLAAAPGGKSTHIGQLMRNRGTLVLNDVNHERLKAVYANVHRMAIDNAVIMNYDGREMSSHFSSYFDRVLLDAPCSCLGVISRDSSIKHSKGWEDMNRCSTLQKELILAAFDCLKPGGKLVYSTCSVTVHENEAVVQHLISRRKGCVRIEPLNVAFGQPGFGKFGTFRFDSKMKHTRRYSPQRHNLDGFFVAKVVKTEEFVPAQVSTVSRGGGSRSSKLALHNADRVLDEVAQRKQRKRDEFVGQMTGDTRRLEKEFDSIFRDQ